MNITEILIQPQQSAWLPWAVQYFLYIGSAYAAAILFFLSLLFKQYTTHKMRAALVLVPAISGIVGSLALTGDLHQPGRAWYFFFHLTPWSWMSLGSLFLPVFCALTVITAWLYLRDDIAALSDSTHPIAKRISLLTLGQWKITLTQMKIIAAITALSGLSIALYTGAEIFILQSRTLWNQPASPLLWFVTAFLGAIGFTTLLLLIFPRENGVTAVTLMSQGDISLIKRALLLSSVLAFVLVPLWASNSPSFPLYKDSGWIIRLSLLAGSFVVCFALAMMIKNMTRLRILLICLCTLFACFYLRWVTIMDVQSIPKYDAGSYLYVLPMGDSGVLSIIGMFGLWMAFALLASELISSQKNILSHSPTEQNKGSNHG
jgi:tetrathionate reductase subunit C